MTNSLTGKKLIILGGNPETGALVEVANNMGIHTIVIDPNPHAPAKSKAAEHFEFNGFDIDGIVECAKSNNVDGVLVGVADILVAPYQLICARLNFPCYANKSVINAFGSKKAFKEACEKYGVQDIPGLYLDSQSNFDDIKKLDLPLMVKPVDNGAGVGMTICKNEGELETAVANAMQKSRVGGILVERYMECDDIFAYYTFKDGKPYLSAIADRITTKKQGNLSPVCIGAVYPSKYTTLFLEDANEKMLNFFKELGIQNGVLNIQFFVKEGNFYAYDPGFRLQGEAPHIHLIEFNEFDHRKMLINFALTGSMGIPDFQERNDFYLKGGYALTVWVLLKKGKISQLKGLDFMENHPRVSFVLQRMFKGDLVTDEMIGTEKQVFARIYLQAETLDELISIKNEFRDKLVINDENNENMIIDWMSDDRIINYKNNG